jgi:photosystem II stability/assembly factor-like uncharacterized protein
MTNIILLQLAALILHWNAQVSNSTAGLRGLCAVSAQIVWSSGTNGTFLRTTDGGIHWRSGIVDGAEELDFRDVEALDSSTAYLLASGEGTRSRVYKTSDAGSHWELLLTNPDPKGFFDALAFWDDRHAILLGDPVDRHFVIFTTSDAGKGWQRRQTPKALNDEGAFAASGTSLVTSGTKWAWFATGGPDGGRVFRTRDGGRRWTIARTPFGGTKTAGIFSLALAGTKRAVAVGGDYHNPKASEHTTAVSSDGGKTWRATSGLGYRSGVASLQDGTFIAVGASGSDISRDGGQTWVHFSDMNLNAVVAADESVWAVGPKGAIVRLAGEH